MTTPSGPPENTPTSTHVQPDWDLEEATVPIPLTCPRCGVESLCDYPVIVVITALTLWQQMRLQVPCHVQPWNASAAELQTIRLHVGETWIEAHASLVRGSQQSVGPAGRSQRSRSAAGTKAPT